MLTFFNKPVINLGVFPPDVTPAEQMFILALLIEEHGTKLSNDKSSFRLRSPIYLKGGIGNVVLDVYKRRMGTEVNKFLSLSEGALSSDSSAALRKFENKYNIQLLGGVKWTGNKENTSVYEYAQFASFADFLVYIRRRFSIPEKINDRAFLDNALHTYSGKVPGYTSKVRSIQGRINHVTL